MKHRVAIYLIYDPDGIVDDYIIYYLKELKKVVSRVVVVCNGYLTSESRNKLEHVTEEYFCRDNVGFDAWGYKTGIEYIGWENLLNYDELIISNYTVYGPFYPFQEMFDYMDEYSVADFWGIHRRYEDLSAKYFCGRPTKHGYMPELPLSNFWVIRRSLLHSYEFKKYWDTLPSIKDYIDACLVHEPVFTKTMCDAGYVMDTYSSVLGRNICPSPTIQDALYQLKTERLPVVRRRVFLNPLTHLLVTGYDSEAIEILKYIKNNTNYDINLICKNLIRTVNLNDSLYRLKLNEIISLNSKYEISEDRKIGLIVHLFYNETIEECKKYVLNFPKNIDVFITTGDHNTKEKIEQSFTDIGVKSLNVSVIPNRGRDISSLIIAAKKFIMENKFEYICFFHDKKMPHLKYKKSGMEFKRRCYDSIMGTSGIICNIISLFDKNDQLGIISAMPPYHGEYFHIIGGSWTGNYEITKKLANSFGLKVDISKEKDPVAPYGTCFWFRPNALKRIFEYDFTYEDFPEEPLMQPDNTILHAIERIFAFVAQDAGYYMSYVISENDAKIDLINLTYMINRINKIFKNYNKNISSFDLLLKELDSSLKRNRECNKKLTLNEQSIQKQVSITNTSNVLLSYEEILEDISTKILMKKIIKRFMPSKIWNYLRWKKWNYNTGNSEKIDFKNIIIQEEKKRSK